MFLRGLTHALCGSLLLAVAVLASEMPFPHPENGNIRLTEKDSPYILEQGVVVSSSDTLFVEPGVTVLMGEYAKLTLRGSIHILGTEAKPVVFRSADSSGSWNGMHFVSTNRPFEVKNFVVQNAFRNTVFRSRGIFENAKFVNNYYGLWVDDVPEVFLARCDFVRNRFALSVRAGKVIISKPVASTMAMCRLSRAISNRMSARNPTRWQVPASVSAAVSGTA